MVGGTAVFDYQERELYSPSGKSLRRAAVKCRQVTLEREARTTNWSGSLLFDRLQCLFLLSGFDGHLSRGIEHPNSWTVSGFPEGSCRRASVSARVECLPLMFAAFDGADSSPVGSLSNSSWPPKTLDHSIRRREPRLCRTDGQGSFAPGLPSPGSRQT